MKADWKIWAWTFALAIGIILLGFMIERQIMTYTVIGSDDGEPGDTE